MLKPFIVTAANSGKEDLSDVEPEIQEIFTSSPLSKDPQRYNLFMFALNAHGEVVHEFHGLPGGGRSANPGRSDHKVEIEKARTLLGLSKADPPEAPGSQRGLPDLPANDTGLPTGVRLFLRQDDPSNSHFSAVPVVEVVGMKPDEWKVLSFDDRGKDVKAESLRRWLVWLYPAGIRAADEKKRFQKFEGTLRLQPAASDGVSRWATLRGPVRLAKGDASESEFTGELQAVLSYRLDSAEVQSLRAVVEGSYLYRLRGATDQKLRIAIESRPQ